ncbi:CalU12 [Glonium stellatum]|uniref:CalU12 n=1 Tax=Glonium stellatum TaxID=574774 RepID=A0A8E2JW08_9PEZI|nr:CalU12 [Glonium stellatum]
MSETKFIKWPKNATPEYIAARNELTKAELTLRNQIESVAEMRRALPLGAPMPDYTFASGPSSSTNTPTSHTITLADLAADGRSVVIYHMMFAEDEDKPCPMCVSFVDALNGVGQHIAQRVNLAIVAKAPLEKLLEWGRRRGWSQVRLLSSQGSDFNKDMDMECPGWMPECKQAPGISVFRKDGEGVVRHVYTQLPNFDLETGRGMDLLSPLWNLLDMVPEGRNDFDVGFSYLEDVC